nr:hypothetical protein [Pandoravirus massiliensis]
MSIVGTFAHSQAGKTTGCGHFWDVPLTFYDFLLPPLRIRGLYSCKKSILYGSCVPARCRAAAKDCPHQEAEVDMLSILTATPEASSRYFAIDKTMIHSRYSFFYLCFFLTFFNTQQFCLLFPTLSSTRPHTYSRPVRDMHAALFLCRSGAVRALKARPSFFFL